MKLPHPLRSVLLLLAGVIVLVLSVGTSCELKFSSPLLTGLVRNVSGPAFQERVEAAKLFNAKMEAAQARQKAAKEVEAEEEAMKEVNRAISAATFAIDQRNHAQRLEEIGSEENAKGAKALQEAKFRTEEATIDSRDDLSHEERARLEADLERRRRDAPKRRADEEIARKRKVEGDRRQVATQNVQDARKIVEDIKSRITHYEEGSPEYKHLELQLAAADEFLKKIIANPHVRAHELHSAK